jgi:hypothetical protein
MRGLAPPKAPEFFTEAEPSCRSRRRGATTVPLQSAGKSSQEAAFADNIFDPNTLKNWDISGGLL